MMMINKILNNKATTKDKIDWVQSIDDDYLEKLDGFYGDEEFSDIVKLEIRKRKIEKVNNLSKNIKN